MKINPIRLGSYNSQYKGQNPNDSQNFKDSSQDSKKRQNFLDIMRETNTQQKEQNNDSTNAISTNSATTPILTPTNPYGNGNGGNYRYNNEQSKQSAEISGNGRNDTATYNGGFNRILGAESRRSRGLGEGSQGIRRINQQEAKLTTSELASFKKLQTRQQVLNSYKESYKQQLLSVIENNLQHIADNPNIDSIKKVDKLLNVFQQKFPELEHNITKIKKQLAPLKKKYLPKNTKENAHKSKSKSNNNDLGMGM